MNEEQYGVVSVAAPNRDPLRYTTQFHLFKDLNTLRSVYLTEHIYNGNGIIPVIDCVRADLTIDICGEYPSK